MIGEEEHLRIQCSGPGPLPEGVPGKGGTASTYPGRGAPYALAKSSFTHELPDQSGTVLRASVMDPSSGADAGRRPAGACGRGGKAWYAVRGRNGEGSAARHDVSDVQPFYPGLFGNRDRRSHARLCAALIHRARDADGLRKQRAAPSRPIWRAYGPAFLGAPDEFKGGESLLPSFDLGRLPRG
jgi:hypothetical protein